LHPSQHLQASTKTDNYGNLYAVVSNPTTVSIGRVQVKVVQLDVRTGRVVGKSQPLFIIGIDSGTRGEVIVPDVRLHSPQELQLYKVLVESVVLGR
jgi:hypothetical protein